MAERRKGNSENRSKKKSGGKASAAERSGFAERRRETPPPREHQSRKKYRFTWLYGLITGVIMAAAAVAACLIFFQVETVSASGSSRYTADEIIAESGIEEGQNMLFLRTSEIEENLLQSLPYLKTVEVHRTLPGSVRIEVTDCEPAAVLVVSNGYWFIDESGKLLELRTSDSGLPNVTGLALVSPTTGSIFNVDSGYGSRKTSLIGLLTALSEQDLLDGVISIDLSAGSEVIMQYTEKYTVKIPYGSDFDYKIRAMNGIIEALAEQNDTGSGVIDLTLDDEWHFIPD